MKLKAIGSVLNKVKQLIILDEGNRQWIGDGSAFYLLPESMGEIDEKMACVIFDIPEDKAANWLIKRQDFPNRYDSSDDGAGEELLVEYDMNSRIQFGGFDMVPVKTPTGKVYFFQTRYLKPLTDADPVLAIRYSVTGTPYLVGKAGMFMEAMMTPMKGSQELIEWITSVMNGSAAARFYQQSEIGADEE